jgi:predicted dehydrogenase
MPEKIRWGLLATGAIAHAFARAVLQSQTGELVAVASRDLERAVEFGERFGIARRYGSYQALLDEPVVEAVYISTPHPQHAEWAIKAAEKGKHILLEKPIALNQNETRAILEAAKAKRVFLMEAYMYRCHPQTAKLVELLRAGLIGEVGVIQATFSFQDDFDSASRIWSNELAGGGIMDVGGYTTSIACLIAGAALGRPFSEPVAVSGAAKLHPQTGVDEWAVGTLKFESGAVASLACGVGVDQENAVRIFGTKGSLLLLNPYVADRELAAPGRIVVKPKGEKPYEVLVEARHTSFVYETDVCGRAIRAGRQEAETPAMSWAESLSNIRVQDAWRAASGLTYAAEK